MWENFPRDFLNQAEKKWSAVVSDTHSFAWFLNKDARLSSVARTAFKDAEANGQQIYVPSIVLIEMRYLVEKRSISESDYQTALAILRNPLTATIIAPLDLEVADFLKRINRADVPDMPDRIIAATALYLGLPLVTGE